MTSESALLTVLSTRLQDAVLPGDPPFSSQGLDQAARFILSAAQSRPDNGSALAIGSVSGSASDRYMRIATINPDMPFLVDSVSAVIAAHGLAIDRLVHPVLAVRRDPAGKITDLPTGDAAGEQRESMIYLESERADAKLRRQLESALAETLGDVRAAVEDWPAMQAAMAEDAGRVADGEAAALLRWFKDGMLTQLGHVVRHRDGSQTNAKGICRQSTPALLSDLSFERAFAWFEETGQQPRAMLAIKSNRIANVHRRVPLDLFIVPVFEAGKLAALSVHAGVWTSAALAASPDKIPVIRTQLTALMEKFGFAPTGHAGKALVHALTTLPHDLLLNFAPGDLERVATAMMSLTDRPRPRLALVEAPLKRHLFAFVWLPRDMLSTAVRESITDLLVRTADGPMLDWSLEVEGSSLAMLRFVIDIRDGADIPDEVALDGKFQTMLRGWSEAVESELAAGEDPSRAAAITARYADAFPLAYRTTYGPTEAAQDIIRLRRLGGDGSDSTERGARLYSLLGDPAEVLRLKLYQNQGSLTLSDAVPVLENFGFRVLKEVPTDLDGGKAGTIHDFLLSLPTQDGVAATLDRAAMLETAIANVLNAATENDAFNRLIVAIKLTERETDWLRAWYRYLRQTGMTLGMGTAVDALQNAPAVTRGVLDLFRARHDPAFAGDRKQAEDLAQDAIRTGLTGVSAINDDRLLRQYRAVVEAMLRTNAFAPAGVEALAFKIDSSLVPGLPKPVPWREIFVYSRRVEGIHLRSGPVARGGLRWSDRRDDFRTEVLGLMKAQRVKNAVIVPSGAKGGFYPKQLPDPAKDREGWLAEGKDSYKLFIRTLLSITDNIVKGKVVHPNGVVVRDGDDPYFVVAADKGTATYSDTANAIAEEYDFWLDDAFASGGSKGYDHKAMGITARGAWLSVQRHFLEMGIDVQNDVVRVAGCGDMSGDVFGNGMLLSKALKLVAAFDHRHVFIDPDPDPATSWQERSRLFALPRSSWDDYDKALISQGGGVFPRTMKAIPLSPEARATLGTDAESIDPDSLISLILKAEVDLLWFGGIGTYIKSRGENNVQVGDPTNDALRVDGADVRASVIGEGANLGCTQAGRIEFALLGHQGTGGRNNADFIDNSAGVDCSDNEVNIKIALASAKRAGRLDEDDRVALLEAMTDEVAALVLEDNRLQALALSIANADGAAAMPSYIRLIERLEEVGQLDRKTEGLADNDTLTRRAADGIGLTRPELAVLLCCSKLMLQEALEQGSDIDDPAMETLLLDAFPQPMRDRFGDDIRHHRLRREIIATKLCNRMINRLGLIHPFELADEQGATLGQVAAAFITVERLLGMDAVWHAIETGQMPEAARVALFDRAAAAMADHIADLLRVTGSAVHPARLIDELAGGVTEITSKTGSFLKTEGKAQSARMRSDLIAAGAPDQDAARIAALYDLDGVIGVARLARDSGIDPGQITSAFTDLGARLGLDWAQMTAARMSPSDPWERLLINGLARDFHAMRLDFLRRATTGAAKADPAAAVSTWAEGHQPAILQFRTMVDRARRAVPVNPAMLAQIASQARNLLVR